MAVPICLRFDLQVVSLAACLALARPGRRILRSNAMIETTTSSSTRVKALLLLCCVVFDVIGGSPVGCMFVGRSY